MKDRLLNRQIDSLGNLLLAVAEIPLSADSVVCFHACSLPYMSEKEKQMDFYSWLAYFDLNKSMMAERYLAIRNEPGYDACAKIAKQKAEIKQAAMIASANAEKLQDKSTVVFQSLSVSELGIYNCDQVARLQPLVVNVKASYKNENNEPLMIVVVYIIDKSINSILKYDGYNNMSPSNFAYSAASPTTMIAFDDKLNIYTFTPEQFAAIQGKSAAMSYTFTLKKLPAPATKKDILPGT